MKTLFKNVILLLVFSASTQSCMLCKYIFISPGRIKPNEFAQTTTTFATINNRISKVPNETYEVIAHGAGSWRFYPMGISKKGIVYGNGFSNKKTEAKNVNKLIDNTLSVNPNISIELDVHYAPVDAGYDINKGFIIHDQPIWSLDYAQSRRVKSYLNQNTLKNTLSHFVKKKYHLKSKVYIEIKVKRECDCEGAPDTCNTQYKKLARELDQFARKYKRKDLTNWLCITSFSTFALKSFRSELKSKTKGLFDYILIAGYTGGKIKGHFAQSKGYVPEYDSTITNFCIKTDWRGGLWFTVRGVQSFKVKFKQLKQGRN